MSIKTILVATGLTLASSVSAAICHVDSEISHRNTQSCGFQSCLGSDNFYGSVTFKIDGEVVTSKRDQFDKLTAGGGGLDFNERGQVFHVDPLGLIDHGDKPFCAVRLGSGDVVNWGIQSTDSESAPGVVGTIMHCVHDWFCYP